MTEISLALSDIGGQNTIMIALFILLLICVALAIYILKLHRKIDSFLVGVDSKNLNDSLSHLKKNVTELNAFKGELEKYLEGVEKRVRRSVQSVKTIRYNPFKGTGSGGNQSFATTFLTEEGNGVVISSLYSREHVSVFSKPVRDGKPEYDLSIEEKEALEKAKEALKTTK